MLLYALFCAPAAACSCAVPIAPMLDEHTRRADRVIDDAREVRVAEVVAATRDPSLGPGFIPHSHDYTATGTFQWTEDGEPMVMTLESKGHRTFSCDCSGRLPQAEPTPGSFFLWRNPGGTWGFLSQPDDPDCRVEPEVDVHTVLTRCYRARFRTFVTPGKGRRTSSAAP